MTFYESARVIIGENDLNLTRIRSLEEDTALVFHHDDGNNYRFRVEDFMTDDGDNTAYVMGTYLYPLDQLKGGDLAEQTAVDLVTWSWPKARNCRQSH